MSSLVGDLSVVRRDVVRAGFTGSRRARCNFQVEERILLRHHAHVLVFHGMDDNFVQHSLGDVSGNCIGNLFWNVITRHVSLVPMLPCTFETNKTPPWFISAVGGSVQKTKQRRNP